MAFNIYERGKLIDHIDASEGCQTADYAVRHWSRLNGNRDTDFIHAEPAA